jgi:hypothetical protein
MTVQTERLRKTDDVAYLECSFKLKKTSTSGTNCSIFLRLNRVNAITAQIRPMQDFCLLDFREVLLHLHSSISALPEAVGVRGVGNVGRESASAYGMSRGPRASDSTSQAVLSPPLPVTSECCSSRSSDNPESPDFPKCYSPRVCSQ